jgi:hypothetical protein
MAHDSAHKVTSAALGLALVGGLATVIAVAGAAQADSNRNITICHATGADGKWNVITVDAASIAANGGQGQAGRNVIPPFTYVVQGSATVVSYPGLNWNDNWETDSQGVATQDVTPADCLGGEKSDPTPTVTVTPTPTVTGTEPVVPTPTPTPTVTATEPVVPTPTPTVTATEPVVPVVPTPTVSATVPVVPTPTVTVTPTVPVVPVLPTPTVTPTVPVVPVVPVAPVAPTPTSTVTPTVPVVPVQTLTPTLPVSATVPVAPVTPVAPAPLVTGPVVETDLVPTGPNPGLVGAGAALVLMGAGATVLGSRRRGSHS